MGLDSGNGLFGIFVFPIREAEYPELHSRLHRVGIW